MEPQLAVVVVPFLAQGHLNQLLHLSHLISSYGLPVHYVGSSTHNCQAKLRLHGRHPQTPTQAQIHFHGFPLPPYTSPPPNPNPSTHFPTHLQPVFEASLHLRHHFFQLVQQLSIKHRRVIVIHDSNVSSVVQDFKNVPHVECYAFISTSAFTTFFGFLWEGISPNKQYPLELDDVPKMVPTMDGCFSSEILKFLIDQHNYLGCESGRIINTSRVIEGKYVELLEQQAPMIKYFAIGPLNPVDMKNEQENDRHVCLEWLDKQEKSSVIYVSFGSTTSMNDEQIMELALGLERSGQKFIWVLRRADTSDVFAGGEGVEPKLPKGYQERVKNMGIIVANYWAPQLEILAHPSIGGFMSHCGWNSCIESISMGVPIAAWPMHSDQPRNAVLVTDVLRIGILVRDWNDRAKVVKATAIEESIIRLMREKEMRKRAKELGDVVRGSVAKDGSSRLELDSFISHITR